MSRARNLSDLINGISADKITSGTFADARISSSSVTQHASSVTNTTGTWTPGVSSGSLSNVSAIYAKVGHMVQCQFEAQLTGAPSMGANEDTAWYMTGLPFTAKSYSIGYSGTFFPSSGFLTSNAGGDYAVCVIDNSTNFYFFRQTNGYRSTQYYTSYAKGSLRHATAYASIWNQSGGGQNWMFGTIYYTAAS